MGPLKVVAENAKTGQSSCKSCSAYMPNKTLRLGLPSSKTKWYHLLCFPHNISSTDLITGFTSLQEPDKRALKIFLGAFQSSAQNQQQPRARASTDVVTRILAGLKQIQQTLDPLANGSFPMAQASTDAMTHILDGVEKIQETLDHLAGTPIQQITASPIEQEPAPSPVQSNAEVEINFEQPERQPVPLSVQSNSEVATNVDPPEQQSVPSPVQSNAEVETNIPSTLKRDTISPVLNGLLELEPPSFHGEIDDDPYEFIDALENSFDVIPCTDAQKVELAALMLEGHAATWWKGYVCRGECSWEEFKRALVKFVLPQSVTKRRADEFNKFRQEASMSITEYEERFNKLSRYASDEHLSESVRMRKFLRGLLPRFAPYVAARKYRTVPEIAEAARVIEKVFFQNP